MYSEAKDWLFFWIARVFHPLTHLFITSYIPNAAQKPYN